MTKKNNKQEQPMDHEASLKRLSTRVHPDVDPKCIYQPPKKPANYYEKLGAMILQHQPDRSNFRQGSLIRS